MTGRRKTPRARPPGASGISRVLISMEHMEQQNRAAYEAVQALEGRILGQINPRLDKIELRLDALEAAVRRNSDDIRENSADIRKNSEDIAKLQSEVARLSSILGADRDENLIRALERRVRALEQRIGIPAT